MKTLWLYVAIFAVVAGASLTGGLDFLENELIDARFRLVQRDASGDVLLVTIDSRSLREVGVWPWPRSLHATAIDRLVAAGARDIAYDVDFSSRSAEHEDARLEDALRRADRQVILPAFVQGEAHGDGGYSYTEPLPRLRQYVDIASINVLPDSDGTIRQIHAVQPGRRGPVPTLPAAVAGDGAAIPQRFFIDYGIRLETIPAVSFASVMRGDFDPNLVAGRHVLVGATAVELSDGFTVPVWTALSGVLVEALALESVLGGRALQKVPAWINLLAVLALLLGLGPCFARWPWRRGLLAATCALASSVMLAVALQMAYPLIVELTPWFLATLLAYGVGLVPQIYNLGRCPGCSFDRSA